MKIPKRLTFLSVLAALGLCVSLYQVYHFYQVRSGAAGFGTFCSINEKVNCDVVDLSTYAEFAFGIPLSAVAGGWFLATLIISWLARNPFSRRESVRALFGLTTVAFLATIAYFAIMTLVIKVFCPFCLVVDAINITSFGVVLSLKPEGFSQHKPEWGKWKLYGSITAACLAAVAVLGMSFNPAQKSLGSDSNFSRSLIQEVSSTPEVVLTNADDLISIGPKDAPVTITKFFDFQCPACKAAAYTLHLARESFAGKVRMVYRNFPLDSTCNPEMKNQLHAGSCELARGGFCAHQQGKFEEFYKLTFDKQAELSPASSQELAKEIGLDLEKYNQCLQSSEAVSSINRDIQEAVHVDVQSTPTFFINGHKVEGTFPTSVWVDLIRHFVEQGH